MKRETRLELEAQQERLARLEQQVVELIALVRRLVSILRGGDP